MEKYYKRYIEKTINDNLHSSGAVLVTGPKFCGKTTTCMRFQKSFIKLNTSEKIMLAKLNPKGILIGEKPRLIDEWQKATEIWNEVKDDLDFDYQFGKYILTGSATPPDKRGIHHSGAGRIYPMVMKPMSLYESLESNGKVSLLDLFNNNQKYDFDLNSNFTLDDITHLVCRGGWPVSILSEKEYSINVTKGYYKNIFTFDESENDYFKKLNPDILYMVLKSYARNISTEATKASMISDIIANNNRTMSEDTFDKYLKALNDLFIIEDVNAWNPNIRSKTSIRTTPTRHFIDTSIACCALNISPNDFMNDMKSFGYFFEDFAIRDLSIYASVYNGEIRHYRDNAGAEVDAIVHLEDGRWGAIEIKVGGEKLINEGLDSLRLFKEKIMKKSDENIPSFMMVLTAFGPLYKTRDGIYVVPINMLKD